MTSIKDLELRIKSAASTLEMLRGELHALKEQEKDKQPEPGPEPESLLGRWATHPQHGRGIIVSSEPNDDGYVRISCRNDNLRDGAEIHYEHPEHLTLDPATLTTAKDFEDAPEGTIVEATERPHDIYVKAEVRWYIAGYTSTISSKDIPACRVIRWGENK